MDGSLPPQERFLAFAAHELRDEIALQRALAEVALGDPDADTAALRAMAERVVAVCERQERLLHALLALAHGGRGSLRRERVDLAAAVTAALRAHDGHGLSAAVALAPALTSGDPLLLERLAGNLIANAVRHNVAGGRIDIATGTSAGRAVLAIANSGPVIAPGEIAGLFLPFRRLPRAGQSRQGAGLGLAIVAAIAGSHDATVTARARPHGGLRVEVTFPVVD